MVYECLKAWRLRNILLMNNTKVILHTSCVNYKFEDLKNMFSLEFDFVIPEDVFFELRLLVKSRVFGVKVTDWLFGVGIIIRIPYKFYGNKKFRLF